MLSCLESDKFVGIRVAEHIHKVQLQKEPAFAFLQKLVDEQSLCGGELAVGVEPPAGPFGRPDVHRVAGHVDVLIEALVAEGAFAVALLEVLAIFAPQRPFVLAKELFLLLLSIHPESAGTNVIRDLAALRTRPDDLVLEVGAPPLPDARQAIRVVAVGQDPEAGIAFALGHHGLHTNAARYVLGLGEGERGFHLLLVLHQTLLLVLFPLA